MASTPGLRHIFFSRDGGVSEGIYAGLNGGLGSSDDPAHVLENRRRMAVRMAVEPQHFLTAHQIHSADVAVAKTPWDNATRPRADAIVTAVAGLTIGVTTADCGPVLFADPKARVIGAAHAGWRGALNGVLESTIQAMEDLGAARANMVAAIGPLIRQPSYEVGAEFVDNFLAADAGYAGFFGASTQENHAMFDLAGFIKMRLQRAGVSEIDDIGIDTYADERFYSYRRSVHRRESDYGRQIHAIVLEP
ncbi:peptidoglycan editing factor PgeF [Rhodopseudomonas sp. P2A-2r]|uniref:peptidoglycan editing factor PgeF n=1 Tax=Rhodopseudomonas sp. P2A-2r TaxID=2991972 RepID=UPI002234B773|nr:peptidoglycan editing factor PgeF [Rhodopseudomonas sp. P2A-2r]UZE52290.1 peptidoglycan editing factor PgeF [Rhodopseudomonas sp. P2A-2r]